MSATGSSRTVRKLCTYYLVACWLASLVAVMPLAALAPTTLLTLGTPVAGEVDSPVSVAIDASGNIYVADTGLGSINKYSSIGTFLLKIGSPGAGAEGTMSDSKGVAVDSSGNVYVIDRVHQRVQKFDGAGNFLLTWGRGVDTGASQFETCTSGCQKGMPGFGDGEFNNPHSIAIDSSDNVYVVSSNTHIQKFSSGGTFLLKWGSGGAAEGQFNNINSLAVDSAGKVYVTEASNRRLQKFDGSGNFERMWGVGVDTGAAVFEVCTSSCQTGQGSAVNGGFSAPHEIAFDSTGNVLVIDAGNGRVQKFTNAGAFLTNLGASGTGNGQLSNPRGLDVDASDNLIISETSSRRVQKWNSAGVFQSLVAGPCCNGNGELLRPSDVAVDSAGTIYIAENFNDRVQRFDSGGNFLTTWGSGGSAEGQFAGEMGVTIDGSGNVYVVDGTLRRVQKFDSVGNFERMWGWGVDTGANQFEICTSSCLGGSFGSGDGQFASPRGIAVDGLGFVYVGDASNKRISKFDSSGAFITKWGASGTGPGEFNIPVAIATDSADLVYVLDHGRVHIFDGTGSLQDSWTWTSISAGTGGIAVGASGRVYIGHRDLLSVYTPEGVLLTTWSPGFSLVGGVDVDPSDRVHALDAGGFEAKKFDSVSFESDLVVTKDDGLSEVAPGQAVSYTISVSNSGPDGVSGATVTDNPPVDLTACSWTCAVTGTGECTAGPENGAISDAIKLASGSIATYTLLCTVSGTVAGPVANTASVALPSGWTDPVTSDNSATDTDTIAQLDFGDASDPSYPTLLANDGARHFLNGPLKLGSLSDADGDGQPTSMADGDDTDGTDDEDGIAFPGVVETGKTAAIDVTVSQAGLLNAWIDFNDDGDWADVNEQIFTDQAVVGGVNNLNFSVPADATGSTTTGRFRISSAGGLGVTGEAPDGEVEDHSVVILRPADYGDAPDPFYPTLSANNGASHDVFAGIFLGSVVDTEPDGQPSAGADGDDLDAGGNDDDGVVFTSVIDSGTTATVDVTASVPGLLNAWIDFNDDGDWADSGEQIFTDEAVAAGVNNLNFSVPSNLFPADTFARFRFSTAGGLSPDGPAVNGEVEDYAVSLTGPGAYGLYKTLEASRSTSRFGLTVGRSGDTVVVGAYRTIIDPALGDSVGTAYIFERDHPVAGFFGEVRELTAPVPQTSGSFGFAAAIEGDILVVTEIGRSVSGNTNAGAAYVYGRNQGGAGNWGLVKMLEASDPAASKSFGASVALSGDRIAIGASAFGATGGGAAYIFERNSGGADNWGEVRKVLPSISADNDGFGLSLDLSGDTLVVDAGFGGQGTKAVYFFDRNQGGADNWGEVQEVTSTFGDSVALEGDIATVSINSITTSIRNRNSGGADNWGQIVSAPISGRDHHLSGELLGVGRSLNTSPKIHLLSKSKNGPDQWGELGVIDSGATILNEGMGFAIAPDLLAIGAPGDEEVQIYLAPGTPSVNLDFGDAPDSPYPTLLASNGAAHLFVPGLHLGASADADADGQPTTDADGDDLDGSDDDDGVVFTSAIVSDHNTTLDITASAPGLLNAWLDFNDDGDWVDSGEQIFTDEALAGGVNSLQFAVPTGLTASLTVARFRFDTSGGLSYDGVALDGEVEDYKVAISGQNPFGQLKELTASNPAAEYFGVNIARSGDTLAVTAERADVAGASDAGAVYLFERNQGGTNNWGEVAEVTRPTPIAGNLFGTSIALSGDVLVVGNQWDNGVIGSAHVYGRNTGGAGNWGWVKTLVPSAPTDKQFGASVAIHGDRIAVGGVTDTSSGPGAVYVFERNLGGTDNWGELKRLAASDEAAGVANKFGLAIDLDGARLAVGAWAAMSNSGAVYLFEKDEGGTDNWGEKRIVSSQSSSRLGFDVSLQGDRLVTGELERVRVFERGEGGADNWGEVRELQIPDAQDGIAFGEVVDHDGDLMGASHNRHAAGTAAYLFRQDKDGPNAWGWLDKVSQTATPLWTSPAGLSVASDLIALGAPGSDKVSLYVPLPSAQLDYGDAPDPTYPTLAASAGAVHLLGSGLELGASADHEVDGQPNATATGDDTDGNDDEDGVTFTSTLTPGATTTLDVVATLSGLLNAWLDFNDDGDWTDSGEQIFSDELLTPGTNNLSFAVPASASTTASTFARFRLSSTGGLEPTGPAADGEVEDYEIAIVLADPPTADSGLDRAIAPNNQSIVLGAMPPATDGTPPYSYSWSVTPGLAGVDYLLTMPTDGNPVFTGFNEQVYTATLTVTDANLLQDSDAALITVEVPDQRDLYSVDLTGTETFEACDTITADLVVVRDGADIMFVGPIVVLGDGFIVEEGANLTVINALPASCL